MAATKKNLALGRVKKEATIRDIMSKLTNKQYRFVECYMGEAEGVAVRACEMAGYTGNKQTLYAQGSQNIRHPMICQAIQLIREADPRIATRNERQRWWTKVMEGDEIGMRDAQSRVRASELLGKTQADFVERHQIDLSVSWADLAKAAADDK